MTTLTRIALILCIVSVAQGQTTNLPMSYPSYDYGWAGVPMDYSHMEMVQRTWRMDSIVYAGCRDAGPEFHAMSLKEFTRREFAGDRFTAHQWSEEPIRTRQNIKDYRLIRVCLSCYRCEVGHYETVTEPSPYDAAVAKARELARKK